MAAKTPCHKLYKGRAFPATITKLYHFHHSPSDNIHLGVRSLVHHPLGGCSEALAALGAGVWLGAGVNPLMHGLFTSLAKGLWTIAAFVGVCIRVHSLVSVKTSCKVHNNESRGRTNTKFSHLDNSTPSHTHHT